MEVFRQATPTKLKKAAEARLKDIASKSTKILFICQEEDRKSLDSHFGAFNGIQKGACHSYR